MYVHCRRCQWDSGDEDDLEALIQKMWELGGRMFRVFADDGRSLGWHVECPLGHFKECHLD